MAHPFGNYPAPGAEFAQPRAIAAPARRPSSFHLRPLDARLERELLRRRLGPCASTFDAHSADADGGAPHPRFLTDAGVRAGF
jgi:hypothetical protein